MFNKIRLWWEFHGQYMHKEFAQGVKNLWRWFPTIWRDRDWDHTFIYELLRVKLEHQAKYIGDRDIHVDAKRDAERMWLVAKLIQLQKDDFYAMEYMDYHDTKYEFVPTNETEKWFTMEDTLISENFKEYFAKYPRQYDLVLKGEINHYKTDVWEKDDKHIAMEIAHENSARCHRLIFKILEEHIERWWD